jgi:hypothetical protein
VLNEPVLDFGRKLARKILRLHDHRADARD